MVLRGVLKKKSPYSVPQASTGLQVLWDSLLKNKSSF
jgi:hypothetical protein